MRRSPGTAQRVYLGVETSGRWEWKTGVVVEEDSGVFTIVVALAEGEVGAAVFKLKELDSGLEKEAITVRCRVWSAA